MSYRGWHVRESDRARSEAALVPGWAFQHFSWSNALEPMRSPVLTEAKT
jgi:hypothetical protein